MKTCTHLQKACSQLVEIDASCVVNLKAFRVMHGVLVITSSVHRDTETAGYECAKAWHTCTYVHIKGVG
jgi:hypothetical protein